jgi:hypothetical protein
MAAFSQKLKDAMRVPIAVGQLVSVRASNGDLVADGFVTEVNPKTGVVRVKSDGVGADLQIDVDTERYKLWVRPPPRSMAKLRQTRTVYLRPSNPYGFGPAGSRNDTKA